MKNQFQISNLPAKKPEGYLGGSALGGKSQIFTRGFTLIELLTVIAIIVILATVILVSTTGIRKKARDRKRKSELQTIAGSLNMKYSQDHQYPCSGLNDSSAGDEWITGLGPYIPSLPVDPLNSDPNYYYYYCDNTGSDIHGTGPSKGFVLMTYLENPNDPDRVGNTTNYYPDGSLVQVTDNLGAREILDNSYVITR